MYVQIHLILHCSCLINPNETRKLKSDANNSRTTITGSFNYYYLIIIFFFCFFFPLENNQNVRKISRNQLQTQIVVESGNWQNGTSPKRVESSPDPVEKNLFGLAPFRADRPVFSLQTRQTHVRPQQRIHRRHHHHLHHQHHQPDKLKLDDSSLAR